MRADGGNRQGHTVVHNQSGQHVNRALAPGRTRSDPAKVLDMSKYFAWWQPPQVSDKRTVLDDMKTATLHEHVHNTLVNRYRTVMNGQKRSATGCKWVVSVSRTCCYRAKVFITYSYRPHYSVHTGLPTVVSNMGGEDGRSTFNTR